MQPSVSALDIDIKRNKGIHRPNAPQLSLTVPQAVHSALLTEVIIGVGKSENLPTSRTPFLKTSARTPHSAMTTCSVYSQESWNGGASPFVRTDPRRFGLSVDNSEVVVWSDPSQMPTSASKVYPRPVRKQRVVSFATVEVPSIENKATGKTTNKRHETPLTPLRRQPDEEDLDEIERRKQRGKTNRAFSRGSRTNALQRIIARISQSYSPAENEPGTISSGKVMLIGHEHLEFLPQVKLSPLQISHPPFSPLEESPNSPIKSAGQGYDKQRAMARLRKLCLSTISMPERSSTIRKSASDDWDFRDSSPPSSPTWRPFSLVSDIPYHHSPASPMFKAGRAI